MFVYQVASHFQHIVDLKTFGVQAVNVCDWKSTLEIKYLNHWCDVMFSTTTVERAVQHSHDLKAFGGSRNPFRPGRAKCRDVGCIHRVIRKFIAWYVRGWGKSSIGMSVTHMWHLARGSLGPVHGGTTGCHLFARGVGEVPQVCQGQDGQEVLA